MTLLAAVLALIGIALAGGANLYVFAKSTRALHRSVTKTDGVGWLGPAVRWGVAVGLRVGGIMVFGLVLVTSGVIIGSGPGGVPAWTAELAAILLVFTVVPLVAAVLGWTLFALFWAARWAAGAHYWWSTDSQH